MWTVVVQTGAANTASVLSGLRRAGANPSLVDTPQAVRSADRVVLPGVGAFGPAMARLTANGVAAALVERVEMDRPTLAICLGFQLLFKGSEESPGVGGLGVIDREITAFDGAVSVPQMGWNRVTPGADSRLQPGWAYFANSYKANAIPDDWIVATSEHGGAFAAAVERGAVLACQFHPELSGVWGQELLEKWLC
jgi:imidazole glycerol phosphate synthase glutamine amidotransferase subunit